MEYGKVHSVAKQIQVKGPALDKLILDTMKTVSSIVGSTLGPGGQPVLIERSEHGIPAMVTKDGVTVFRSIGFNDAAAHCVMEAARDASIRTASEAGDGTTTATILAEAIVRHIHEFTKANPRMSPQRVVRHLEKTFRDHIEPAIVGPNGLSRKVELGTPEGDSVLKAVATVSANGDTDLADAVMKCFGITGDEGNVTIVESNGRPRYEIEKVDGFAVGIGYEDSCSKYYPQFINDPGSQRSVLEKPVFVLYHGRISDIQTVQLLLEKVGQAWANDDYPHHNVVLVACGFSDTVLASLALNFSTQGTINVFPLQVPNTSPQSNAQLQFLADISAVTGAMVLDPLTRPLDRATLEDLGPGVKSFEAYRFRSSILGYADETLLMMRIDEISQMLENPESELDAILLRERKAKLSGGIARLRVWGVSNGELKEKRDRAEDAVCAVRGAIKHGCLPGGGWTLLKLCNILPKDPIIDAVLRRSFMVPVDRLFKNSGITDHDEITCLLAPILHGLTEGATIVYDFLEQKHVDAFTGGLLDSTPAVLEAIRNSISIAALLGTLGGTVVFARDHDLERTEARANAAFLRDANTNEADQRQ